MNAEQVIIIGAGPAGLAAAIQLKRYGIDVKIFERRVAGGLLLNANLVENYPGFPAGIPGPKLVKLFIRQAHNLNIKVTFEEVTAVDHAEGLFQVKTAQRSYAAPVTVFATGTKPLHFSDLAVPADLADNLFYEVYPLLNQEGKSIIIVGGGDAAFDYGLNLSRKNQVMILNRSESPKCLPLLWQRAQQALAIKYLGKVAISHLEKSPQGRILIDCRGPDGRLQLVADYLVGALGREAQMDCVAPALLQKANELEEQGVLYRIGDVKNGIYRQTSIAVGEGVLAAMKIYRYLKEN